MPTVSSSKTSTVSAANAPKPPSVASQVPKENLKVGSRGAAVLKLQNALVKLGHMTAAERATGPGIFGKRTEAAVKEFQRANGVDSVGLYGPKTRAALTKQLTAMQPKPPTKPGPATKPEPKPTTTPTTPATKPTASTVKAPTAQLKEGAKGAQVKQLQTALAKVGFSAGPVDGSFGKMTKNALMNFQARWNQVVDGFYGPQTQKVLAEALAGKAPPKQVGGAEPAHDYRRVNFRGVTINVRTQQMILKAEEYARKMGGPTPFAMTQGSYHTGVAASAGTHDHGGVVDIRTRGLTKSQIAVRVKALRMAGFAAWSRGNGADSMTPHIHACAVGDRELASLAKSQVRDYFAGRNGLSGGGIDPDRAVGRPAPAWTAKYR